MTQATEKLVEKLCKIIDKNKFLMLSGASASGKTFLATEIANMSRMPRFCAQGELHGTRTEYEIISEIIPIHPTFSYEDFISGISVTTDQGGLNFNCQDRVFLQMLALANRSWEAHDDRKYFIILDDIGRGDITGIFGDALPLLETHGRTKTTIKNNDGVDLWLSPNIYIIATQSTTTESIAPCGYGFMRRFYSYSVLSDYHFMSDDATEVFSEFDIQPYALFYKTRRVIQDNLRHRYQLSPYDKERFVLGHGVFKGNAVSLSMKYQVIPLLRQYIKDGILDSTARIGVEILEKSVTGQFCKDAIFADTTSISGQRVDVDAARFYSESGTHQPIVNLVSRIKNQQLLSDDEIANLILFNPGVIVRKNNRIDGANVIYPQPGYLYVKRSERSTYIYGTTRKADGSPKSPRYFYSANRAEGLVVKGIEYAIAQEMQPKEYIRWKESYLEDGFENVQYSGSPNLIMFRIIRNYYETLVQKYDGYLALFPNDENVRLLRTFAKEEFRAFVNLVSQNGSGSDEADVNLERNRVFREEVQSLRLLWADKGQTITWMGQTIKIEGVYKVDNLEKYKEYSKAMSELDIHQMIMQGPPGTSKTYSAREFLKFVGKGIENDDFLSEEELQGYQIKSYDENALCTWMECNEGNAPTLAWDIVQFHPSYGYEDFVRGIEVTTAQIPGTDRSAISYDTVNKVLGKMAEVAGKEKFKDTKFFLVIDEINRANLATVFGELIYGLEYRGRSVATPYSVDNSNKVTLPDNLFLIGTMNTADKSIGGIDYAIRRRFLFFSLLPDKDVIAHYREAELEGADAEAQIVVNTKAVNLFEQVSRLFEPGSLNPEYYRDDVQIGHTYFLVTSDDQLFLRFKYQIVPILREYYKDGMFQFEIADVAEDGWNGLLNIISGNRTEDDEEAYYHTVFDMLIG